MKSWRQLSEDHVAQNFGRVVVILGRVFDEAEAVDVAHDGLTVGAKQVEAANGLQVVVVGGARLNWTVFLSTLDSINAESRERYL